MNRLADIERIIDFLETDNISIDFTDKGLKYLSLKPCQDFVCINLRSLAWGDEQSHIEKLIIEETGNFLDTGRHNMPLDLAGFTSFQRDVFNAVSQIEPGMVIYYKDIAESLGKPGAAQAVGSAIARNPVSYFLPTHRVIPQKGIAICRSGAGHLKDKLLIHEGHDIAKLRGNYICTRNKCCQE